MTTSPSLTPTADAPPSGPPDHLQPDLPVVDDSGLVRFRDRWVAIPTLQLAVVEVLLANLGRVVPIEELRRAYDATGGSTAPAAMRSLMRRVGERLTEVGAAVYFVRPGGGMMVTVPAVA